MNVCDMCIEPPDMDRFTVFDMAKSTRDLRVQVSIYERQFQRQSISKSNSSMIVTPNVIRLKNRFYKAIPDELPGPKPYDLSVSHAPKRKRIVYRWQKKKLAIKNALRYFHPRHHEILAPEFYDELLKYGRIYMYRFRAGL